MYSIQASGLWPDIVEFKRDQDSEELDGFRFVMQENRLTQRRMAEIWHQLHQLEERAGAWCRCRGFQGISTPLSWKVCWAEVLHRHVGRRSLSFKNLQPSRSRILNLPQRCLLSPPRRARRLYSTCKPEALCSARSSWFWTL